MDIGMDNGMEMEWIMEMEWKYHIWYGNGMENGMKNLANGMEKTGKDRESGWKIGQYLVNKNGDYLQQLY